MVIPGSSGINLPTKQTQKKKNAGLGEETGIANENTWILQMNPLDFDDLFDFSGVIHFFFSMYCLVWNFSRCSFYISFLQLVWRNKDARKVSWLGLSHSKGGGIYTACPVFSFLCNFQSLSSEAGMCCQLGHWLVFYQYIQ